MAVLLAPHSMLALRIPSIIEQPLQDPAFYALSRPQNADLPCSFHDPPFPFDFIEDHDVPAAPNRQSHR